ncbi:FOB1 (YDR110W) [Zygosaccharomyces parabailii]|nr:FOB1 (YDR110W) [Zygosaccharomyces parabailii]
MAKKKRLASEQLHLEGQSGDNGVRKQRKSSRGVLIDNFILSAMDQKYTSCLEPGMDSELLEKGAIDSFEFQGTVVGQLTQPIYELIKNDALTLETLENNRKWKKESAEVEYSYLTRRYYSEDKKVVRDRRRSNKVVCEPACMFHLIMCCHVLNHHMTGYSVHRNLAQTYANVTRDFIVTAVRYCTKCKPNQEIRPFKRVRHKNVFWGLLPLERVHIEIFKPFEGLKIENKFSAVLYCRDYYSRYVWMLPLKNRKRKHLISALSAFLLNLARVPMYLETTTIDRDDLFDICGQIAERYKLRIGLGVKNSQRFHKTGIRDMQQLLHNHKEECLQSWNMCLLHGPFHINQRANISSDGIPVDLQYSNIPDCGKKFKRKREELINELPPSNVVELCEGVLFLENENSDDKLAEDSDDSTDQVTEDQSQSREYQNSQVQDEQEELLLKKKEEERRMRPGRKQNGRPTNGQVSNDTGFSSSHLMEKNDTSTFEESNRPSYLPNDEHKENKHSENQRDNRDELADENDKAKQVKNRGRKRSIVAEDFIDGSDELISYASEAKSAKPDDKTPTQGRQSAVSNGSSKSSDPSTPHRESGSSGSLPQKKKRKLLSKKLQRISPAEASMEL